MTKELAITYHKYIKKIKRDYGGDLEMLHVKLDNLILELLKNSTKSDLEIGPIVEDIINEYKEAYKWYA